MAERRSDPPGVPEAKPGGPIGGEWRRWGARAAILVAIAAVFVLLRAPFLSLPLERDEGEYAYIAQRLPEGDAPYRDAFDQKPPGVFLAYRAAFALFGQSIEGIHAFLYLWTAATACLLFLLVRRLADAASASFAALVFAVVTVDPCFRASAANSEQFILLPITASTYCLFRALAGQRRDGWWLLAGGLAAAACWFKPVAVANGVFVVLYAVAGLWRAHRPGPLLRAVALMAVGGGVVSASMLIFLVERGALASFVDAVVLHNLVYTERVSLESAARSLGNHLATQAKSFTVLWAFALLGALSPKPFSRRTRVALVGWFAFSFLGVALGRYFRFHYFIQMLPALSALSGLGLAASVELVAHRRVRFPRPTLHAMLAVLVIAPPLYVERSVFFAPDHVTMSREIYDTNPFPESIRIADWIRRRSTAEDEMLIVGSEPQIFFYARRRSASRYIFFYPLLGKLPGALDRQREFIAEATASQPLYVVVANVRHSLAGAGRSHRLVFRAVEEMLTRNYRLEMMARWVDTGYRFIEGDAARALLEKGPGVWGGLRSSIGVFRRVRARGSRQSSPRLGGPAAPSSGFLQDPDSLRDSRRPPPDP